MILILLNERRKIEVTSPYVDKEEKKRDYNEERKKKKTDKFLVQKRTLKNLKNETKSLVGKKG